MFRFVAGFLICALLPSAVLADKRVALVIGNSAYQHTPTLINPRNDATDMATALKAHGFQVIEGFDLDKSAFDRQVREFADALSGAKVRRLLLCRSRPPSRGAELSCAYRREAFDGPGP